MSRSLMALLVASCSFACGSGAKIYQPACRSNSDCKASQVCFSDGCGDPGQNVVVEVTPAATDQAYPQEFPLGTLAAREDLELAGPTFIEGNILQRQNGSGGQPVSFSGIVSFTASGQSTILPGLTRRFDSTQVPVKGNYALQVAGGTYSMVAYPADQDIPPLLQPHVLVSVAQTLPLDFIFPAPSELVALSGQLITGTAQPSPLPAMAVQALTPERLPLSQRVFLDGGEFHLSLAPPSSGEDAVLLVFTPRDSLAVVPQKTFHLASSGSGADGGVYVLGDYGLPMVATGRLLTGGGQPVSGATVHLEGGVGGGGTYQSSAVQTDALGSFALTSLPSDPDAGFQLIAVPPPESTAGILVQSLQLQPGVPLGDLHCPTRVTVTGAVTLPEGTTPASGVTVTAVPLAPVPGSPTVPPQGAKATTDAQGNFAMTLDPAVYRFDFDLDVSLPVVSAFGVVDGTTPALALPPTVLLKGRLVEGNVTLGAGVSHAALTPAQALVRFYRRVDGADGLPPTVLGQTYTDAQGHYRVSIPTR